MPEPRTTESGPHRRAGRDCQIVLAITFGAVVVILALWIIARNAPSAKQLDSVSMVTKGVSGAQGCDNFADFWMVESGLNLTADVIAHLTNCRPSKDGSWFVPANGTDLRLSETELLTPDEQSTVAVLRKQLADDLAVLERSLPRSFRESLKANYESENLPVFGHTRRGRTDLGSKRLRYVRIAQSYLMSPRRAALADYVGWTMERKLLAVESFESVCFGDPDRFFLNRACIGVREEFAVRYIPFYWELNDPTLIREYLVARARSGEPLPVAAPPTIS